MKTYSFEEALVLSREEKIVLNSRNQSIYGVMYDGDCKYAPFKIFQVDFDPTGEFDIEGPWYSVVYNGGFLIANGSDAEGDYYGGETVEATITKLTNEIEGVESLRYFVSNVVDTERYAEYVLADLLPDIPSSNDYWPDNLQEYHKKCVEIIRDLNTNLQVNEEVLPQGEKNVPKGKAKIKFIGGCNDGFHDDAVDTRMLVDEIEVRTGYWYREEKEGVSIMKGGTLCENWHSFGVHVYKKYEKAKDGYFVYKLSIKKVVDRCSALTKQGKKCKNSALLDLSLCAAHKLKK